MLGHRPARGLRDALEEFAVVAFEVALGTPVGAQESGEFALDAGRCSAEEIALGHGRAILSRSELDRENNRPTSSPSPWNGAPAKTTLAAMRSPQSRTSVCHLSRLLLPGLATLLLALASCVAPADGVVDHSSVQAHNQRPFIGRDTHTTPDSFFEVEVGGAVDPGEEVDVPVLLKYGLGPRTEFFAGTVPYRSVDYNELAPDGSGWGDSLIGVRHRFRDKDMYSPAYGFQFATKLPTAKESKGLGSGEMDFLGALMAEQTYYGTDVAGFYQLGLLGETADTGLDLEHTFAAQGRRPVNANMAAFGEAAFVWQPEIDREELTAMGGVSFIIDDFTLLDVGVRFGISADAPDVQLLFGLTRTLGLLAFPQAGDAGQ
jgi:hypothetical protein